LDASIAARLLRYGLWAGIVGVQLVPGWLAHKTRLLAIAASLAVVCAGLCAYASLMPAWPRFLAMRFAIDAQPFDAPGIFGRRLYATAQKDAVVLIPPGDEAWDFKLYARRAVVVDNKDFPFTDRGILEWKDRMDRTLGTPLVRGLDTSVAWRMRSPSGLSATAAHYSAGYVLTRDDWHPKLPGKRIDQEKGWSLWELP